MKLSQVFLKKVGVDIILDYNITILESIVGSEAVIEYLDNKINTFPEVIQDLKNIKSARGGHNVIVLAENMLEVHCQERRNRIAHLKEIAEKYQIIMN